MTLSLLLFPDLILYYLPIIPVAFRQRPALQFQLFIDIGYVPVYLCLFVVVLLAVLCPQFGAVAGNQCASNQVNPALGGTELLPGRLSLWLWDCFFGN